MLSIATISYSLFLTSYYVPSLILYLIDKYNRHNITDYNKCFTVVLFNTLFGIIPGLLTITWYIGNYSSPVFSFYKMITDLIISTLLVDVFFYSCHRLLHTKPAYKKFHKLHHKIKEPIGFGSLYSTLVELYVGNIIPVYLPLLLLSSHCITLYAWIIITTLNTVILSHSGYKQLSRSHDLHHEKFNVNYGVLYIMDKLFGTYHE